MALLTPKSSIIEHAKFTYCSFSKAFFLKKKKIEDQWRKQVELLKVLKPEERQQDLKSIVGIFSKEIRTDKIENELDEIRKWQKNFTEMIKIWSK